MALIVLGACELALIAMIAAVWGTFGLLRWVTNRFDRELDRIDRRFDQVDQRMGRMDARMDHMSGEIDGLRSDLADHLTHHAA